MRQVFPPKKVMFFAPHPDDIEMGCPFMFFEALRLGYKVIEVVMTNGEFGTFRNEFKGRRLAKIRRRELSHANEILQEDTKKRIKVIRMGYVDGYLPLNIASLNRVRNLIQAEGPNIIFAPDPLYPQDYHHDHLNTGKLVYYALFKPKPSETPRVFYYYSTKAESYFKCHWTDLKLLSAALNAHQSQFSPLAVKLVVPLYKKLSLIRHLLEKAHLAESYREQKFEHQKPLSMNKFNFWERLIYYIFSSVTKRALVPLHSLTPEEVGLDRLKTYLDY